MKVYTVTTWFANWNKTDTNSKTIVLKNKDQAKELLRKSYEEIMQGQEVIDSQITDNDFYVIIEDPTEGSIEHRGKITEDEVAVTEYDLCRDVLHHYKHNWTEEQLDNFAEQLANDDYAWSGFDTVLCEIANNN